MQSESGENHINTFHSFSFKITNERVTFGLKIYDTAIN